MGSKTGKYLFEPYAETEKNLIYVSKDKTRFTRTPPQNSFGEIAIFGGSISMGHGVDDKEKLSFFSSAKNQKIIQLKNYSVGGYGTYQSFLKIEEILKRNNNIKSIIVDYDNHAESKMLAMNFG